METAPLKTRTTLLLAGALAAIAVAWAIVGLASAGETQLGDANCDGRIDSIDALFVLQFHAGLIDELCGDGDVNGDGEVNSIDALFLLWPIRGLSPFPQPTPTGRPPEPTPEAPSERGDLSATIEVQILVPPAP